MNWEVTGSRGVAALCTLDQNMDMPPSDVSLQPLAER